MLPSLAHTAGDHLPDPSFLPRVHLTLKGADVLHKFGLVEAMLAVTCWICQGPKHQQPLFVVHAFMIHPYPGGISQPPVCRHITPSPSLPHLSFYPSAPSGCMWPCKVQACFTSSPLLRRHSLFTCWKLHGPNLNNQLTFRLIPCSLDPGNLEHIFWPCTLI